MSIRSTRQTRALHVIWFLALLAHPARAQQTVPGRAWAYLDNTALLIAWLSILVIGLAAIHWRRLQQRDRQRAAELQRELTHHAATIEALENSQKLLDAVFNSSVDALCTLSGSTRQIIDCNHRAVELFECGSREDLLGRTGHSFAVRPVPDDVAETAYRRVDAGETWTREMEFTTLKGRRFWGALAVTRLQMADRWILMARVSDITASRKAEGDRVRNSAAIEQATEAIVITDVKGVVEFVNPAFERVSGYKRAEVLGKSTNLLKSGHHSREFYNAMWKTISEGNVWFGQLTNRRKDGSLYEEEGSITPVRDAAGSIVNFVAVKRDVTREIQMEAHLRQQQKLESIGTLASGVAHEINNPLTGIINYGQFIADDPLAGREARECGQEIVKEAERMACIVRDLLAFARHDTPKTAHLRTSIGDVIQETLSLVRTVVRHDGILLDVDIAEPLPQVICRGSQIQQVVLNLVTNARDALNLRYARPDPGKWMNVRVRKIHRNGLDWVRTTVEDNGCGITAEVQQRMFDPFFTTKPKFAGTGLGLSISHGIVREHGGTLTAESHEGEPTRFHLDLPAVPAKETQVAAQPTAQ